MSNDIALREANRSFEGGSFLYDNEVTMLLNHYGKLQSLLDSLNLPEYKLVQRDVWAKVDRLREIKNARKG